MTEAEAHSRLSRRLGLAGAVAVGLGAMLGTGVFASWTPALSFAGGQLLVALGIAAAVAGLNAWSSVRLAAIHPVSGGSYSYGRRWLGRPAGVVAGVSFVVGKSASAGAAALTIGAYVVPEHQRTIAVVAVGLMLSVDLLGVRTSATVTAALSVVVIGVLVCLVVATSHGIDSSPAVVVGPKDSGGGVRGLLEAASVLFVAFAGYARVTVLGEEVRDPRRTIPRAVLMSLLVALVLYFLVGAAVLLADGAGVVLGSAPLSDVARVTGLGWLTSLIPVAAVIAAGTALMSLMAGMGRTLFAMAHGGDAPAILSRVSGRRVPMVGELAAAALVLLVIMLGGIAGALALSAGSIGLYYAVAHLSALRMAADERPPPRWVPCAGLVGCAALMSGAVLALLA